MLAQHSSLRIMRRTRSRYGSTVPLVLLGVALGFALTMCLLAFSSFPSTSGISSSKGPLEPQLASHCSRLKAARNHRDLRQFQLSSDTGSTRWSPDLFSTTSQSPDSRRGTGRNLAFVGVMTAQKYVDTRAVTIHQTWGQSTPGRTVYFVSESTKSNFSGLPLVKLKGVDDTYPPQKKSFMMFKHMYDHYVDRYDWFLRADDDVYIRGDKLEVLLRSLNSSKPLYLGQAGLGTPEEYGNLSLATNENYCMGGTGMILSRATLQLIGPHIKECLQEMYTTHEDVEIGRCIKRFAGVTCSWAYEMQTVFYNNQSGYSAYTGDLNVGEVHRAVTLHPVKQPMVMKRLHSQMRRLKCGDLRFRSVQLNRDIRTALRGLGDARGNEAEWARVANVGMPPSLTNFKPRSHEDLLIWDYLSPTVLFCAGSPNCPRHNAESYLRYALNDVVRQVLDIYNKYARQRGRVLEFQDLLYGYRRVNPLHGADYVLDLLLLYKKFKGRKVTVPVRRHTYLQQTFSELEMLEETDYRTVRLGDATTSSLSHDDLNRERIHIILPLCGRLESFQRFLLNFERTCLQTNEGVQLFVVLFDEPLESTNGAERVSSTEKAIQLINSLRLRYSSAMLNYEKLGGKFSRGLGLAHGAHQFPNDSLLFFTDVDIVWTQDVLHRIRLNTIRGQQIFYPIVFSEFSPTLDMNDQHTDASMTNVDFRPVDHFHYEKDFGYFRHFGFGLVSLYRSDLDAVGGLTTSIQGWGLEDVDLFEKTLKSAGSELDIFRAPEPGLVHVYHPVICDKNLPRTQYEMCLGSKAASYASVSRLYDYVTREDNVGRYL